MKIVYIGTYNNPILGALLSSQEVIGIAESVPSHYSSLVSRTAFKLNDFYRTINGQGCLQLSATAKRAKIPFFSFTKEEQHELALWLKKMHPDVLIVYSMNHLLSKEIVDLPHMVILNYHPSILPQYRGPNPDLWLYYNMDLKPGGTVHLIDSGEDTGDILFSESFEISLGEPYRIYKRKSQELGAKLVLKAIKSLENGFFEKHKQMNDSSLIRAPRVNKLEYKKMIEWDKWSVKRIFHFLRGLPNPIYALSLFNEHQKNINNWIVLNFHEEKINETPGQILKKGNHYKLICKDGFIEIKPDKSIRSILKSYILSSSSRQVQPKRYKNDQNEVNQNPTPTKRELASPHQARIRIYHKTRTRSIES